MFAFCRQRFRWMVVLEAAVCGAVESYCVTLRCVSTILSTAHFIEGRRHYPSSKKKKKKKLLRLNQGILVKEGVKSETLYYCPSALWLSGLGVNSSKSCWVKNGCLYIYRKEEENDRRCWKTHVTLATTEPYSLIWIGWILKSRECKRWSGDLWRLDTSGQTIASATDTHITRGLTLPSSALHWPLCCKA